ncbi:MAG TPA: alkaline phosphatase family protein, partial [Thermoanaerobaculia bacterium]|nr:alkaline phosphatase family protein [Thermoanaerobaculia bacterium]
YRTERRSVVVANIGTVAEKRPAILVAIRNLPHDWIITMAGEGLLPFFEEAGRKSYFTRLEPFPTPHWRSLWASLATGKLPNRHGVTGRYSYRTPLNREERDERFLIIPSGVGFRAWGLIPPVERIAAPLPSGNALPVWSLYELLGLDTAVVSWPAITRPVVAARADTGDAAQRFAASGAAQELLAALSADVAALQAAPSAGDAELRVIALEGLSRAQRALRVTGNELPDRSTERGEAIRAYLQLLDRSLGDLARQHPDHLIVLCSPSALVPPELAASAYAIAARVLSSPDPGADDGFLLLRGPGVVHRPNPETAYVVDVVPTLLFAAGLPVGRDMDGRVLTEAFADDFLRRTTLSAIQTYEAQQVVVRGRRGA